MEQMYKTALGGWKIWDSDKDKTHEPTHILLSLEEYGKTEDQIKDLERKLQEKESLITIIKEQTSNQIRKEQQINNNTTNAEIKEAWDEAEKYKKAFYEEKNLNTNLIQVARERGNKARKLPKKGESYIIQDKSKFDVKSIEKTEEKLIEHHNTAWKIKITTPWDCSLKENDIDKLVMADVKNKKLRVYEGIKYYKINPTNIDYTLFKKEPLIIQRKYYCNVKMGFWEVTFIMNVEPAIEPNHRGSRYA